jgi:transposase
LGGRGKTLCGARGKSCNSYYDRKTQKVGGLSRGDTKAFLELEVRRAQCMACGNAKQEKLDFIADNPIWENESVAELLRKTGRRHHP